MAKTFVDELIEVNKRIPRRLIIKDGRLISSDGRTIPHKFLAVSSFRIFGLDQRIVPVADESRPYSFQLGRGDFRGFREVSREEAHLALGHDFKLAEDDNDILSMLKACETGLPAKAYVLGTRTKEINYRDVPVAYFEIPQDIHRSLAINPDEYQTLIRILRTQG